VREGLRRKKRRRGGRGKRREVEEKREREKEGQEVTRKNARMRNDAEDNNGEKRES
jgi:hypothetical protein